MRISRLTKIESFVEEEELILENLDCDMLVYLVAVSRCIVVIRIFVIRHIQCIRYYRKVRKSVVSGS